MIKCDGPFGKTLQLDNKTQQLDKKPELDNKRYNLMVKRNSLLPAVLEIRFQTRA